MPIFSTLAARIGTDPAPARWSPYARPRIGGGSTEASRPHPLDRVAVSAPPRPMSLLLPARQLCGCEMTNLKSKPKPAVGDETLAFEKTRPGGGGGGFVFLCAFAGHTEAISGISMPLGSGKLCSGSVDRSVRVWDGNSGKAWSTQTGMKLSLQGPSGLVCSMTIKNEMLFAGTEDGCIMAWKFPSKEISVEPVAILSGHERRVISLSISATNLYSGSLDKTIKCVQTLSEHKASVTSVLCWDQMLLVCSLDKTVKVWTLSESGSLEVKYTHAEEHGLRTLRVGKTPV